MCVCLFRAFFKFVTLIIIYSFSCSFVVFVLHCLLRYSQNVAYFFGQHQYDYDVCFVGERGVVAVVGRGSGFFSLVAN